MTEHTQTRHATASFVETVSTAVHFLHGTRGLAAAGLALMVLGIVDPLIPSGVDRTALVLPVFLVLIIGAGTLAREGVAAQARAKALLHVDAGVKRLYQRLLWPVLLIVLLAPRLFLGAYGVPHMSPLTGLVLPSIQQRLTHGYLFLVLLVAVLYIRSTRRYARHIIPKRPKDLSTADRSHQERDGMLWMSAAILVAYAVLLRPFWAPFSLLAWPPGLESISVGARGVGSIAFSLVIPLLLFVSVSAHAALARDLQRRGKIGQRPWLFTGAVLHVVLGLAATALHAYDLLWIAQYRSAAPF